MANKDPLVVVTPQIAMIPLRPVYDESYKSADLINHPVPTHFTSGLMNFAQMEEDRRQIAERYRQRYVQGDHDALYELLEISPMFACDPRILDAILEQYYKKFPKRRGRRKGCEMQTTVKSLIIATVVEHLRATNGWSREKCFGELEKALVNEDATMTGQMANLKYESIKRLYQHAQKDERLKPLLFERPELRVICHKSELPRGKRIEIAKPIAALRRRRGRSISPGDVTVALEFSGSPTAQPKRPRQAKSTRKPSK